MSWLQRALLSAWLSRKIVRMNKLIRNRGGLIWLQATMFKDHVALSARCPPALYTQSVTSLFYPTTLLPDTKWLSWKLERTKEALVKEIRKAKRFEGKVDYK